MLFWEGGALLACIFLGGGTLFYYLYREMQEGKRLKEFFAAFTHEIKTPLASARLKSEILKEKIADPEGARLVGRILQDVGRLSLQLENSLFLADKAGVGIYCEPIKISDSVQRLADFWPELQIVCEKDCTIETDRRALDAIFANIFHNSVVHGKATRIDLKLDTTLSKRLRCTATDNGLGFHGIRTRLGKLFHRHYPGSGSGIGLFLVGRLMESIGGRAVFPEISEGFRVVLEFPEKSSQVF